MDIYNIELLEVKRNLLSEVYSELNDILLYKIRSNSKAYGELKKLLFNINKKIITINDEITENNLIDKNSYINLKIEKTVYQSLSSLKNELKIKTISELLNLFEDYYKKECLIANLSSINQLKLSKDIKLLLNKTNFYICNCNEKSEKIIYKIDDILIYNEQEYLDLKEFSEYIKFNELFLFSSSYTLKDINMFFDIYKG